MDIDLLSFDSFEKIISSYYYRRNKMGKKA